MKRTIFTLTILFLAGMLTACSGETVEVTRIVTEQVEVEVPIEVTRIVSQEIEVTKVIEIEVPIEVTRLVEVEIVVNPTTEPTIEYSSGTATSEVLGEVDLSTAIAYNFLGEAEQDGIKVELARVIYMHRDAFDEINFDDDTDFDNDTHVGEIIWRITNDTDKIITWSYDDVDARINGRQIDLYDWLFNSFGETPTDDIYPGSSITGGVWFGTGELTPDEVESFGLILGQAFDPDFNRVSSPFIIDADLPLPHDWQDLPDELK